MHPRDTHWRFLLFFFMSACISSLFSILPLFISMSGSYSSTGAFALRVAIPFLFAGKDWDSQSVCINKNCQWRRSEFCNYIFIYVSITSPVAICSGYAVIKIIRIQFNGTQQNTLKYTSSIYGTGSFHLWFVSKFHLSLTASCALHREYMTYNTCIDRLGSHLFNNLLVFIFQRDGMSKELLSTNKAAAERNSSQFNAEMFKSVFTDCMLRVQWEDQ